MTAFDLQCHSTYSDGALPPAEVMRIAHEAGCELVALTDHDTVDGVAEAEAAATELGMRFSRATEISSVDGVHEELHVLGYEVDHLDAALNERLKDYRADRQRRVEGIADRLEELGFAVDRTVIEERKAKGLPIGRPHIADSVLQNPANAERLEAEGISDKNGFFPEYIVPGAKAYVPRSRPLVPDAIEMIHAAGGVAVWAHPFWDIKDPQEVLSTIDRFVDAGLDGVEVFYAAHDEAQTKLLYDHCAAKDLLMTGSADFHSVEHNRFDGFRAFQFFGLEPVLGPIGARS